MADFVGLLKKTIESQSQVTPQLRQRIYERARATVERKLAESQAPGTVVERQRDILNRAIDEVESYYREIEAREPPSEPSEVKNTFILPQNEPLNASFHDEEPPLIGHKSEPEWNEDTPERKDLPLAATNADNRAAQPEPEQNIAPDLTAPPPFEEAFEREEALAPPQNDDSSSALILEQHLPPSPILAAGNETETKGKPPQEPLTGFSSAVPDAGDTVSSFEPVPIGGGLQSAAETAHEDETAMVKEKILETEIPSLASLLGGKQSATTTPSSPTELPPLDLPFLTADNLPESEGSENRSLPDNVTAPSGTEQETQESDLLPQNGIKTGNLPEGGLPVSHIAAREGSYSFAGELLARLPLDDRQVSTEGKNRPPLLEDYLPHWSMEEKREDIDGETNVESEIDKARREIEALRAKAPPQDEYPFSPFDIHPLPVDEADEPALVTDDTGRPDSSEADFNNNLVSEIFVQAAKREQHQSNKKRRMAAYLIGAIVLAVLAAIGGVLVLTNGYQFGDEDNVIAQTQGAQTQAQSTPLNNNETGRDDSASTVTTVDTNGSDNLGQKITRRLLPDGEETDPGPALDSATPGEGVSEASATLPAADNSARAVFYEAPTDILPATASEGRVEWSLRRSQALPQAPDGAPSTLEQTKALAVVGDVKIPALDMTLRLTLRRNHDDTVPADYLTEIIFVLPDDFDGEAIDEIGPILFKASEQSTGQELAGTVTAKVRDNLFLMAVRAPRPILDRNLALMRQLPWLKLNVLYKNGRVGEFSIAKGESGNRIFQQAIDEWSRTTTADIPRGAPLSQAPSSSQDDSGGREAADDGDIQASTPPSASSDTQN